ncbi:hypothetical protein [Parasedimentitalea psychrophila]|uniref:Uncharacterized protein n=1 Tax=Parasedimentitalea psychrophila TaxID=2997337 RepID=A0A9Y2P8R0_9RHOB|nr:hypothetical protein [Parasedimentitalea psychrophila]WIY27318.1 hypothetical protein QPJ95_10555 [Parasedimentitalea psychrophila]
MSKSGTLIEKKVKAFASGMETRMTALRTAKVKEIDKRLEAEAKKAKKPTSKTQKTGAAATVPSGEDMVMKLTFIMSKGPSTKGRTAKQQATEVAEGDSWTCSGSHMNDSARHINMYTHGPGKSGKKYMVDPKKAFGSKEEHICNLAKFKSEWVAEMKKQDLRNHGTGTGYGDGDDYHLELPDSRIPRADTECVACVDEYCRLVVMEGYKNNTKFEKSWAGSVKAPMAKYLKEKATADKAKRIEELKKMRFKGKLSASGKLFSNATKTTKASVKTSGAIMPPKEIQAEAGKMSHIPLVLIATPKKGTFTDVFLATSLSLALVKYQNLEQVFVKEVRLDGILSMKGLLSRAAAASASVKIDVTLADGTDPTGKATVEYSVDGLGPDDHKGKIIFDIKGSSSKILQMT